LIASGVIPVDPYTRPLTTRPLQQGPTQLGRAT
jgi:hypothetical protein